MGLYTFVTKAPATENVEARLLRLLKIQQGILAFCHLVLATVIISIADTSYVVPVRQIFNRWRGAGDGCDNLGSCTIVQAEIQISGYTTGDNELGGLDLCVLVPFFSFISGAHHLFAFTSLSGFAFNGVYEDAVQSGANYIRAIDYASSASLILLANALLFVSPGSLDTLILTVIFMASIILTGYASEGAAAGGQLTAARLSFIGSLLLFLGYAAQLIF